MGSMSESQLTVLFVFSGVLGLVVGWLLQFVGHYFEGKPPEFFKDWRFLFVGLRWWYKKILGIGSTTTNS